MPIRMTCPCGARFLAPDDRLGQSVPCPKCRAVVDVPETVLLTEAATVAGSTWQPRPERPADPQPRRSWARLAWVLLILLPVGVLVGLWIWQEKRPRDPRVVVARKYLDALAAGDQVTADGIGLAETHPKVVGVRAVDLDPGVSQPLRGPFTGLTKFHQKLRKDYQFDEDQGRFVLSSSGQLATGLKVLDAASNAKEKGYGEKLAKAFDLAGTSGKAADDAMDDAIAAEKDLWVDTIGELLKPAKIAPTYKQLLDQTDVALTPQERQLAGLFAAAPQKWRRLLGRSFLDIQGGKHFTLHRATVTARVYGTDESPGGGGHALKLDMVRFELDGIDTGWRVWDWSEPSNQRGSGER